MMSLSLSSFFWLSAIYMYAKYKITHMPYVMDILFLITVIIFMYFINVNIMQTKCGSSSSDVYMATFMPWVIMLGGLMLTLKFFPEWKAPFSNTLGYLVAKIAGGKQALFDIVNKELLDKVYNDPSLLINQISSDRFHESLDKYKGVFIVRNGTTQHKYDTFFTIIKLKDCISEWIWYLLTASIAISTSYSMIMNSKCQNSPDVYVTNHNIAMATPAPVNTPPTYVISD